MRKGILSVLTLTVVALIVAALADAPPIVIASLVAAGGVAVWAGVWVGGGAAPNADLKLDDIGRAIMVSVLLAVLVGVPQFLIDRQQKQRDFRLSLTLQQDLDGADLEGKDLSQVHLAGKSLRNANLRHT